MKSVFEEIEEAIRKALPDAEVRLFDPLGDGVHLEAVVASNSFLGKSLIQQHRMVMQPLSEHFRENLHALSVKTYTLTEWHEKQRDPHA